MAKDPKRVAAGKRAKAKGNRWQSDVAKLLTEWSGEQWKATPRSGGLRWGGCFWTYGDLTPPLDFPIVFECKHYHEIEFIDVLGTNRTIPGGGIVADWWYGEACADAFRATNELRVPVHPVLVWKADRRRPRLSFALDKFNHLGIYTMITVTTGIPDRQPFVTVDLSSFLREVDFERFKIVFSE
jgi:hypothetical protein